MRQWANAGGALRKISKPLVKTAAWLLVRQGWQRRAAHAARSATTLAYETTTDQLHTAAPVAAHQQSSAGALQSAACLPRA
jgi:hypothetical protein